MDEIDCVIAGAGVVGLAIARALSLAGIETIVLEAADNFGTATSSRNSEVIHAGIYYPRDSQKHRLCLDGRKYLYDFCTGHNVTSKCCGKLIVATSDDQLEKLEEIRQTALLNGVDDITWLSASQAIRLEPDLSCSAALLSPSTGIIDSHSYMAALFNDAQSEGCLIAYLTKVKSVHRTDDECLLVSVNDDSYPGLKTRFFINSAGLNSVELARNIKDFPEKHIPPSFLAKGNYFTLTGRTPFKRLIYPIPEPGGLGIHLTLDLGGQARFGPDVEWIDQIDYHVDPKRAEKFYKAIRSYWPGLQDDSLIPAYAGIRPKISSPNQPTRDFVIEGPKDHHVAGIINLFGIESPGLTGSLAIGELVAAIVRDYLG